MAGNLGLGRLRSDRPVYGTFIKLPGDDVIDIAATAGLDFVVIDLEHSQLDDGAARAAIRRSAAIGLPALVRVAAVDGALINRLLEAGARGIQLSGVRSRDDVDRARAAGRYPPSGRRSISLVHPAAGYGHRSLGQVLDTDRDEPPLLVGQVESAPTIDPLPDLAAGLDVVFIGPTDLSVDLGVAGQLDHPRMVERMAEIATAAIEAGRVLGGWAADAGRAEQLVGLGARYVVISSDAQELRRALIGLRRSGEDTGPAAKS